VAARVRADCRRPPTPYSAGECEAAGQDEPGGNADVWGCSDRHPCGSARPQPWRAGAAARFAHSDGRNGQVKLITAPQAG
jgi:hypothetical protein